MTEKELIENKMNVNRIAMEAIEDERKRRIKAIYDELTPEYDKLVKENEENAKRLYLIDISQ